VKYGPQSAFEKKEKTKRPRKTKEVGPVVEKPQKNPQPELTPTKTPEEEQKLAPSVPYGPPSVFGIGKPPMLPPTTKPEEEQKLAPSVPYGPPSVFGIGEDLPVPEDIEKREVVEYGPPSAFGIGKDLPVPEDIEEREAVDYGPPPSSSGSEVEEDSDEEIPESKLSSASPEKGS